MPWKYYISLINQMIFWLISSYLELPGMIKHQVIVMNGPTIVTQMEMVKFVAIMIPIENLLL